jgi:hypothetical protein
VIRDAGEPDFAWLGNLPTARETAPAATDSPSLSENRDDLVLASLLLPSAVAQPSSDAPGAVPAAEKQSEAPEQVADAVFGSLDLLSPFA